MWVSFTNCYHHSLKTLQEKPLPFGDVKPSLSEFKRASLAKRDLLLTAKRVKKDYF